MTSDELDSLRQQVAELREQVTALAARREVDLERVNIVEPDGTLRLAISNKERAPDGVIDGKIFPREDGNDAGLIFYNDLGDECGGLVFGARAHEDGHDAGMSLTLDQFRQDQVVGVIYLDRDGRRSAGLHVWDRPDISLATLAERHEQTGEMPDAGAQRLFVGRNADNAATVALHDAAGKVRLRLVVAASGAAAVEFLDADGTVVRTIGPD